MSEKQLVIIDPYDPRANADTLAAGARHLGLTEDQELWQEQARLNLTLAMAGAARELRARMRLQELMSSPPACTVCGWFPRSPCPANMPNCPNRKESA